MENRDDLSPLARLPQSPLCMSWRDTGLLVVDMQTRMLQAVRDEHKIVWNARRLLDATRLWDMPAWATEQYPKGLGPTAAELAERLTVIHEKLQFSCGGCGPLVEQLKASQQVDKILVVGVEAHICVQQTALDLLTEGYQVFVAADAVSSRFEVDQQWALSRLEASGVTVTTTEAALFEWCRQAGTAEFKQISALAREVCPAA